MMFRSAVLVMSGSLAMSAAWAAMPSKNDYANGVLVDAGAQPMTELPLPDDIYRQITRADLGDLRVFNADGTPVPHAFCAAQKKADTETSEQIPSLFELREGQLVSASGERIAVQTPGGTRIDMNWPSKPTSETVSGRVYIIDTDGSSGSMHAIRFDWQSPDGASEVKVRIEGSDDLDRWQTLVPVTTLLRVQNNGQELRRERVELPPMEHRYLRVQRVDSGPPLAIADVRIERAVEAQDIEPMWFNATRQQSSQVEELLFDAEHLAPVTFARLRLPTENSSVSVTIQSRPDTESSWRTRWSGESYLIVSDTSRRESPPAQFEATTDRYWRVHLLKDPEVYQSSLLELGYRPARLRFLTQGPGPFTIAFGSRRAELAQPSHCDGLLADVSAADRERMIDMGYPRETIQLGGPDALKPLPKKTSIKVMVLWAVLVIGAGLLVAMAMSLLKRVKT